MNILTQVTQCHLQVDIDTMKELKRKLDKANKKLKTANTIIGKNEKINRILRQRVRQLKNVTNNKLHRKQKFHLTLDLLHQVFHKDQIEYLKTKSEGRHLYKWSNETIEKALRLKHACGNNGYTELLCQYISLPATRTLRRRLECITFEDGICDEVFDLLRKKISNFPDERYTDCMICVDKMSLTPDEQINPCTNHG